MKILFITPSYKPAYIYGGPAVSVSELAEALVAAGHSVTVYTTTANGKEELEVKTGAPLDLNGVTVYYFKRQTGDHTHISFGLWRKLKKTASDYDVIHLQSWWSLLIIGAAAICRLKGCEYIISPRGMLSAYSFERQHSLVKKIIHRTVGLPLLKKSQLHATTELEWYDCLRIHQSWRGFILPNLVRFPQSPNQQRQRKRGEKIVFGFLSRIDQKKGLELLLKSLANINFDYQLQIAGSGEESYISSLKKLVNDLGIDSKVEWCGWKTNEEKFQFLQSIDVFVLTSYNENFANTVIESLIIGTPVFISKGVGLADYVERNVLGWTCETNVISITDGLQRVFTERQQIDAINQQAPMLIKNDFSKERLAQQYGKVYQQFI